VTGGEPTRLIGSWTASGTGIEKGTVLRLADDGLTVFSGCQVLFGEWTADPSGLFLADVNGVSSAGGPGCAASDRPELPAWLARASGFRTEGSVPVLQDDAGAEVARLRPGARPTAGPDLDPSQVVPPTVTDEARRRLAPPAALPATLTPPARESLAGRWVPAAGPAGGPRPAHVVLAADGTWQGSDGCNGTGGRWATGPGGVLLATGGVSTLIGCDNVPVGTWLVSARRVGLDGEVLVLLDAAGTETGRLRRDG
jgi:heat shock protein HslJ